MTIKCSKVWHIYNILITIAIVVASRLIYIEFSNKTASLFMFLIPMIILIRYWIVVGRTITIDKEGCVVKFLFIEKRYKWKDLKTKRIENYSRSIGTSQPYTEGVIFSSRYIGNPFSLMPVEYSLLSLFPGDILFSYFFIFFEPHPNDWPAYPNIYVVEKSMFTEFMLKWNVDIECLPDLPKRKHRVRYRVKKDVGRYRVLKRKDRGWFPVLSEKSKKKGRNDR